MPLLIYLIGFIGNLLVFHLYGYPMDEDYKESKTRGLVFAFFWPVTAIVLGLAILLTLIGYIFEDFRR